MALGLIIAFRKSIFAFILWLLGYRERVPKIVGYELHEDHVYVSLRYPVNDRRLHGPIHKADLTQAVALQPHISYDT